MGLMIFGDYQNYSGGPTLDRVSNILYQATSRIIWSIGLGGLIYGCLTSNGGIINRLLSHSIWVPLSRLSFSAYLIHATFIYAYLNSLEKPIYLQDSTMVGDLFLLLTLKFI